MYYDVVERPIGDEYDWIEDYDNIVLLIRYLAENETTSEVVRAVEKPWEYRHQFNAARDAADLPPWED